MKDYDQTLEWAVKGEVCFTSSSLKKWVNISPSKCRPKASGKEAYLLNGESNKLGKRRMSSSELAGVDDNGGLMIAWEFMLRKEVVIITASTMMNKYCDCDIDHQR